MVKTDWLSKRNAHSKLIEFEVEIERETECVNTVSCLNIHISFINCSEVASCCQTEVSAQLKTMSWTNLKPLHLALVEYTVCIIVHAVAYKNADILANVF